MDTYDRHLRLLARTLIIIRASILILHLGVLSLVHYDLLETSVSLELARFAVGIFAACISMYVTKNKKHISSTVTASIVLLIVMAILLFVDGGGLDSFINVSLLLICLSVFIQIQIRKRLRIMEFVSKREPNMLDLRFSKKEDLFNQIIIGPHLEPNQEIISAIDRFLKSVPVQAPLHLSIHMLEPVSEHIQATLTEVIRLHYQDEVKRVEKFLLNRYARSVTLIGVSIAAMRILSMFTWKAKQSDVWMIVSNFAAFSLWQIGATHFERTAAFEEMTMIRIALGCKITFY